MDNATTNNESNLEKLIKILEDDEKNCVSASSAWLLNFLSVRKVKDLPGLIDLKGDIGFFNAYKKIINTQSNKTS